MVLALGMYYSLSFPHFPLPSSSHTMYPSASKREKKLALSELEAEICQREQLYITLLSLVGVFFSKCEF